MCICINFRQGQIWRSCWLLHVRWRRLNHAVVTQSMMQFSYTFQHTVFSSYARLRFTHGVCEKQMDSFIMHSMASSGSRWQTAQTHTHFFLFIFSVKLYTQCQYRLSWMNAVEIKKITVLICAKMNSDLWADLCLPVCRCHISPFS